MKAIEVFQKVKRDGLQLAKQRKDFPGEYDCKGFYDGGKKKGWVYIDALTANAVLTVFNSCNDVQKERFEKFNLISMVNFSWKCIK